MEYLPPGIIAADIDMDKVISLMQPQDVKRLREYCMIHFPGWMYALIVSEAAKDKEKFEDFVRRACFNEVMRRIKERE